MFDDIMLPNPDDEMERWKAQTRVHARDYTNLYMMVEDGKHILVIPGDNNDWIYLHGEKLLIEIRDWLNTAVLD